MMKNRIKKTMRKTVVGLVLLSGIVMAGVNPASASTLKDIYGNPVVAGQEYYLESYEYPWLGIYFDQWSGTDWARLGTPREEQETVKIIQSGNSIKLETNRYKQETDFFGGIYHVPLYLSIDFNADGVALGKDSPYDEEWWTLTVPFDSELAAQNYFALKNYYNNKFMSFSITNGWFTASKSNMDYETLWILSPKR
ncbi:hypothetical protein [Bacillus cereus]|uniref:hypothetical protein n=1 Tax=Bacillus cereus TaxID=1396 RepID=UPI000BF78BE8|nr:hypothetical protein [Bacillus cereus]PEQ51771.1 hypothetical protein CN469_30635 [Bacillus cereus]